MKKRKLTVRSETTSLLSQLLDNPLLPAYIEALPVTELARLVENIGKEDAQPILLNASARQITALVENDTWSAHTPGQREYFEPGKYLEWMDLWYEQGVAELCRRLQDVGSEILALTLQNYVVVVDNQEVGVRGWNQAFGRFTVIPSDEELWPQLQHYIAEVWSEEPEYMEEALAHVCMRRSLTAENTHINLNENLACDVEAARDQHRRSSGYVTPQSAAAFLLRVRRENMDQLLLDASYDAYSAMHLRKTIAPVQAKTNTASMLSNRVVTGPLKNETEQSLELDKLLRPLLDESVQAQRLFAKDTSRTRNQLESELQKLQNSHPHLAAARRGELLYLSNILMEGTTQQCTRLNERDALLAASYTSNLGLRYCLAIEPWDDEAAMLAELLQQEPGLLKVFSIGYRLLMDLAQRVEESLLIALDTDPVVRRLQEEPWLARQIRADITRYTSQRRAARSHEQALQAGLDKLLIILDASACTELLIMGSDLPCMPRSLTPHYRPGIHVERGSEFIGEVEQLDVLFNCLDELELRLLS